MPFLHKSFERSAARVPDATALVCGQQRLTYRELDQRADRIAAALRQRGVLRGDRVAIHLGNQIETVVSILGALKAGAAFMMVNATTKAKKLRHLLGHSRASVLISSGRALHQLDDDLGDLPGLRAIGAVGPAPKSLFDKPLVERWDRWQETAPTGGPETPGLIDLDMASLLYTSGSTGEPKGVVLTHANWRAAIESIVEYLGNNEDDVILNVLPLSFGYGLTQLFPAFHVGATLVLEQGMAYPRAVALRIAEEGATAIAIVATISAMFFELDLSDLDLSSVRYVTSAGAALPPDHIPRLEKMFPRAQIIPMYGQTECLRISYLPASETKGRPSSVGRGIPNQEHWLINDSGERIGPGEVGQLVVRGSHVMPGYWDDPEQTARKLGPGPIVGQHVMFTHDLFRQDEDGFLYFVSREDDIFKSRGEKVSPKEVEDAIYGLEWVKEVAVVGVADEVLGHAIKAVIVPIEGAEATEKEVLKHCAQRLEDFLVPKYVSFRESLPKTSTGKIVKREL